MMTGKAKSAPPGVLSVLGASVRGSGAVEEEEGDSADGRPWQEIEAEWSESDSDSDSDYTLINNVWIRKGYGHPSDYC